MVLAGREVTILGAGIGGLTAAVALAQRGAKVTVLERSATISEVGAGLQISPNGVRVFDALGMGEALREASIRSQGVVLRDYADGREVLRMDLPAEPGFYLMHRADLIGVLSRAVREANVTVRLSHETEAVDINDDGTPAVRLADGRILTQDLVVGADGLHSPTRKAVERSGQPFFTGQVAWRMVIAERTEIPPEAAVYMGPGRHLVTYPLRDGKARNIVAVEERESWTAEGWHHTDDSARVRRAFSAFCPEVRGWLESAREVNVWGLFRHPVAEQWYRGRVALLGDAAHPTLPFLAQGANMAVEDAWVLAATLASEPDVGLALARYQALRRPRVARAVEAANANARAYHLPTGLARTFAYTGLRMMSRMAPTMPLKRFDWLYSEDVTAI